MHGPFGELLIEAARQAERAAGAAESSLRRIEQVSRDMFELSQRVAKLEKGEERDGEERRDVKHKSETSDNTLKRLLYESKEAKAEAIKTRELAQEAVAKATAASVATKKVQETIGRRGDTGKRRWTLLRIAWTSFWTVILPGLVALLISSISKGGKP